MYLTFRPYISGTKILTHICLTFDEEDGVRPESLMCPLMFSDGLGLVKRFKKGVDTLRKDMYSDFHQL